MFFSKFSLFTSSIDGKLILKNVSRQLGINYLGNSSVFESIQLFWLPNGKFTTIPNYKGINCIDNNSNY